MKLENKIQKITEALKTPNYFFFKTEDRQIMLYLEGENVYQFRGHTMKEAVMDGENFIKENFPNVDKNQMKMFEDEDK